MDFSIVTLMLSCAQLFTTPWTVAHQAPLSVGFSRQEYWDGLPCPPPEDLCNPGIEHKSPVSPALQADSLPTEPLVYMKAKKKKSIKKNPFTQRIDSWKMAV